MIFLSTHPIGAEVMPSVRLRHLLRYLSKQNRQVYCICPDGPENTLEDLPGITILSLPGATKWSYVLRAARETAWLVRENSSEIVVSSIPAIQSLMAAALARRMTRVQFRLVLEVRDPFSLNQALPWSTIKRTACNLIERVLLQGVDQVIFLTSAIQSMYLEGFPGQQPWKTRNTVITNGFQTLVEQPEKKKSQGGPLTITYVGHFYDRRHPMEFLTALRDYLHNHPEAPVPRVLFAGQVHGNDLHEQVNSVCDDPNLQKCVQWLGTIPHAQAAQLMQNSDINLLITHDQGSEYAIPGKLFEYMGARRPILAITRDPLLKQLMNEIRLGWTCEYRSEITQWLSDYLSNAQALQDWQPNDQAMTAYHWETIHPRWMNFVENGYNR